jgi:hypothetical protein
VDIPGMLAAHHTHTNDGDFDFCHFGSLNEPQRARRITKVFFIDMTAFLRSEKHSLHWVQRIANPLYEIETTEQRQENTPSGYTKQPYPIIQLIFVHFLFFVVEAL